MVIFWGSQSGRGEMLARRLAKNLSDRFGLRTLAMDLDDFDHNYLTQLQKHHLCGFVLSTYGDGEPPDNANGLWDVLQKLQAKSSDLENFRYIMFGLGNSNYRQFNFVAEHVDQSLRSMGAIRYGEAGRGDDANGNTESAFSSWRRSIEDVLKNELQLNEQDISYRPSFTVHQDPSIPADVLHLGEPESAGSDHSQDARPMPIPSIYKLWEDNDRLCLHVDLELGKDRSIKYKTGDHLAIWPSNPDHEVERLLLATGFSESKDTPIRIEVLDGLGGGKIPVPSPTTIHALFRYYLEICATLSPDTIAALALFTSSESVRSRLRHISENPKVFRDEILARHVTLADILETSGEDARWEIPLSFLLERIKPMKPRYYSICSSTVVQARKVSITAVVTKTPTCKVDQESRFLGCYGVTTAYLQALEDSIANGANSTTDSSIPSFALSGPRESLGGAKVFGQIRRSSFKLPPKPTIPVIMIGAGTGVAPFRGFMQERARMGDLGQPVGKTLLFMGFRHPSLDFIYQDDWSHWAEALGPEIFRTWTAFSRETKDAKVHVQDRLRENTQEVMGLLEGGLRCYIYICGSAAMARDVLTCLREMKMAYSGVDEAQATSWLKQLRRSDRLLEDVWG